MLFYIYQLVIINHQVITEKRHSHVRQQTAAMLNKKLDERTAHCHASNR